MYRRANGWMYLVVALIVIGLFSGLAKNPVGLLLPLAVFGTIFYLYKFPPRWLLRMVHQQPAPPKQHIRTHVETKVKKNQKRDRKRKRRKDIPFKVIDGNKKDFPPRRKSQ